MMFFSFLAPAILALATLSRARAESHNVELINNCGSGRPVFLAQSIGTRGPGVIQGAVKGGVAWVDGLAGKNCQSSGVNCGIVEFTLVNPDRTDGNTQNAADYSLLDGPGLGNHKYVGKLNFQFTGSCTKAAPGPCTGNSASQCPGAYLGSDTTSGRPVQCAAYNAGIKITFC